MSELDFPKSTDKISVIATANSQDSIYHYLKRYGRFDRQIYVGLPEFISRIEILEHLLYDNERFDENIDYEMVGRMMNGLSCLDINDYIDFVVKINDGEMVTMKMISREIKRFIKKLWNPMEFCL